MGTKVKRRTAAAFTSSDALLFEHIRKVDTHSCRIAADECSTVTSRSRRRPADALERILAGGLDADLSVIAVGLDLHDCARSLGTADSYERPARDVGGGIEFDNPRAAENARATPSVERRDHLALFAFARFVDDEEGRSMRTDCGP
jgi:hypothetical protein